MTDETEIKEFELELPAQRPVQLIPRAPAQDLMTTAAFDVETATKRLHELQSFVHSYMVEGEDFGTIPGTPKPTLYKSGADKLCDIYALADSYRVTSRTEDWDRNLFDYEIECSLLSKRSGQLISTGLGSCNSYEGRYRWREMKRICPNCQKETIIKGKTQYGGGWLCWNKPGKSDGCGAKFGDGDTAIEGQAVGKIQNEDIPTLKNTILKMAKKRAKVDAVLSATRSSGLFTQDMEESAPADPLEGTTQGSQAVADKKLRESAKGNEAVTLTEWKEGTLAISGAGFSIIKANLSEGEKKRLDIKYDKVGKVDCIKASDGFVFSDMCKKYNVEVKYAGGQV